MDSDVVVVGAGFAGLYLIHTLREAGLSVIVLEAADGVGGTWYWNRYPGARCDIDSIDYQYHWSAELREEWQWSERYATQPEILRYANFVADRFGLRDAIRFDTRVDRAEWDDAGHTWTIHTDSGEALTCRHYVMATGCLSVPKEIDIAGTERFQGPTYLTGKWPHEGVDFTGKRVAVIGTGSSAIQSIPLIAAQADQVTVFQRTANFSVPAHNGPPPADKLARLNADPPAYAAALRTSAVGTEWPIPTQSALAVSDAERNAAYETSWARGGLSMATDYIDHLANTQANDLLAEFVRGKIRATVTDPETAELLCPTTYPITTKRLCVDTDYYATFNRPNVRLVDINRSPITTIDETGVQIGAEHLDVDAIVFATGFDAMTGAIVAVDIRGRDGRTLRDYWSHGSQTYLGLMAEGFPNLFFVTGPGSPSVLSNMLVSIEQHVEWITQCITDLRRDGFETIEPTQTAVAGWVRHVNEFADITLMPLANSWYLGANVPGKPRVFLPYVGGVGRYRATCDEVVSRGYLGFTRGNGTTVTNDGVIRRVKPDVQVMLEVMAEMGLPPLESMEPAAARMFMEMTSAVRPPGPAVAEVVDGTYPGAAGPLSYRLYRNGGGGGPLIVYFHGGGWVLGSHESDDPYCRDLCVRTGGVVVSCDYRHGPEARFPAAYDDAVAALKWAASEFTERPIVVAGWSAGANQAAVVAQWARDNGGPEIAAQFLMTPVTDGTRDTGSYRENADGYILTAPLMEWFFGHYVDEADRLDPRVAPIRAESLTGLPPAVVVTCEFDPLRDEGEAYVGAMRDAGVTVVHIAAQGHTHTSLQAVDALVSGVPVRAEMAAALADVLG